MTDDLRTYLRDLLASMNYPVAELTDDTPLGPSGLDLDSLTRHELAYRIEDDYGRLMPDDEIARIPKQTFGELTEHLRDFVKAADR